MSVCGIDLGSFKTPSYVAWLEGKEFLFDLNITSKEKPLPSLPTGISKPTHCALDGPQSLPLIGNKRRECDKGAKTPTSVLPLTRQELSEWKMYKQLIECGIEVFWNTYEKNLSAVAGLNDNPKSL
jgi:predicted nuclease with RNAse H fold